MSKAQQWILHIFGEKRALVLPIKLFLSCVEIFVVQSQRHVLEYMMIYSRSDSDELIVSLINGCLLRNLFYTAVQPPLKTSHNTDELVVTTDNTTPTLNLCNADTTKLHPVAVVFITMYVTSLNLYDSIGVCRMV